MSERSSQVGYEQTRRKLAQLECRLKTVESRTDLKPDRLADVKRSYQTMIRQYRHDIKLYEAIETHAGPVVDQS